MTDTLRMKFEAWYFEGSIEKAKERYPDGGYRLKAASTAWSAWQAATLSERERCAVKAKQCGYEYFADALRGGK